MLRFLIICGLTFLFWTSSIYADTDSDLQFSGFTRIVLGHLDDKNATYVGYDNSVSVDQQSLIGIQADYLINDTLSLTGQLVGYTEAQRNSGLEWLYITYKPNNALQFKLGKQRIPFFNYSDSLDIGFAYPWLTLPQQFYDTAFFSTFDGILANYQFTLKDWLVNYEAYWGRFDDKIYLDTQEINTQVIGLFGVNASLNYRNLTIRAAYNQGDAKVEQAEARQFSEYLSQLGFNDNAKWLNANGLIQFYQFSVNYDHLNYFFRSEVAKMVSEGGLVADIDSYYISAGFNFDQYTAYISFSDKDLHFDHISSQIPLGVSNELDILAATYLAVLQAFPDDSAKGTKIGLRWDYLPNLAFKTEVTFVAADKISNDYAVKDLGNFDGHAILYQFGAEWIF